MKLPLILGGAPPALIGDRDYLSARGVRVCLQGHQPFAAAVKAAYATLKALRDGAPPEQVTDPEAAALLKRLTREAAYSDWGKRFLE